MTKHAELCALYADSTRRIFLERDRAMPDSLPPPPADWKPSYAKLAV